MIEGGLGTWRKKTYRLMNHGSQTLVSYEMYSEVGTEKTSATGQRGNDEWIGRDSRSISSRVSCFVSRTKQNIMPQAIKLRPA